MIRVPPVAPAELAAPVSPPPPPQAVRRRAEAATPAPRRSRRRVGTCDMRSPIRWIRSARLVVSHTLAAGKSLVRPERGSVFHGGQPLPTVWTRVVEPLHIRSARRDSRSTADQDRDSHLGAPPPARP